MYQCIYIYICIIYIYIIYIYIYMYHIYTSWRLLRKLGVKTLGPCPPITSTSARSKSAESIWLTPDSGAISPGCTACLGMRLLRKHCWWKMFILIHALLLYLFPNKPLILSRHHHSLQTGSWTGQSLCKAWQEPLGSAKHCPALFWTKRLGTSEIHHPHVFFPNFPTPLSIFSMQPTILILFIFRLPKFSPHYIPLISSQVYFHHIHNISYHFITFHNITSNI